MFPPTEDHVVIVVDYFVNMLPCDRLINSNINLCNTVFLILKETPQTCQINIPALSKENSSILLLP